MSVITINKVTASDKFIEELEKLRCLESWECSHGGIQQGETFNCRTVVDEFSNLTGIVDAIHKLAKSMGETVEHRYAILDHDCRIFTVNIVDGFLNGYAEREIVEEINNNDEMPFQDRVEIYKKYLSVNKISTEIETLSLEQLIAKRDEIDFRIADEYYLDGELDAAIEFISSLAEKRYPNAMLNLSCYQFENDSFKDAANTFMTLIEDGINFPVEDLVFSIKQVNDESLVERLENLSTSGHQKATDAVAMLKS